MEFKILGPLEVWAGDTDVTCRSAKQRLLLSVLLTFRALGLHSRCAFLSSEALLDSADSIMRWANDPTAIERLAARADDVTSDTLRELDDERGAG